MMRRVPISKGFALALAATVVGSGSAGCARWRAGATDSGPEVAADAADRGVPLTEFAATDGRYFPKFLGAFFPGAAEFARQRPTLTQARDGVVLIEVKPLNGATSKNNEANLSWSADGVYLGFEVLVEGFRKIMVKDMTGGYARELQVIPKGSDNFLDGMVVRSAHSYNAGLRWSRDSTRFAFMSNGGVGEYNIYVGAVGAAEKPIAQSPTKDGYATWSPSTNEIAFVSGRSGNGDVYLVGLGDQEVRRLSTAEAVDIFPDWFPSGNRLVWSSGDALDHDLVMVERSTRQAPWSRPFPLTDWQRDDLRPTVSPDGRHVAFYADDGTDVDGARRWNIHVVPFVPGRTWGEKELASMVVARDVVIDLNTGPAWSPDSSKLFYVKRDPSVANPIHAYDLFTGRSYVFRTGTRMNRDILMSRVGVLSFRAQAGAWDRVYVALTNQGLQLQEPARLRTKVHYLTP
jgi:hypothetical protein